MSGPETKTITFLSFSFYPKSKKEDLVFDNTNIIKSLIESRNHETHILTGVSLISI